MTNTIFDEPLSCQFEDSQDLEDRPDESNEPLADLIPENNEDNCQKITTNTGHQYF